ncbi:hypothetical protein C5C14_01100 [Rathayibacter rathayi]|nr:hypothetical protein C5C14_01100 [Rathayibacter rathayi]PPI04972.1 hypothetical protein C5C43_01105 [Rathayibacter rathayi]
MLQWMRGKVVGEYDFFSTHRFVSFQNAAQVDLGFQANSTLSWSTQVQPRLRKIGDDDFTNLLDYLLATTHNKVEGHPLEAILSSGGSAWTVTPRGQGRARLTKRVPEGVQEAVNGVLTATDEASLKLQEAWADAYGVNPRGSVAFSNAVVAVEIAALSVIKVNNPEATLSSLFSILEAENSKWTLIFRDSEKAPGSATLAAMLRALWRGHESRHGREAYADASLEESRAAVILAATLVQWFTSGVVVPVKP